MRDTGPAPAELLLFGRPRLQRGGHVLHVGTRKAITLLALLALEGPLARERLASQLWPDVDIGSARRNLRREVFRLRELGCPLAETGDAALALAADLCIDVHEFRSTIAAGDDATALQIASAGVLDGLDGVAGPELDRWLERWRTELLQLRAAARQRRAQALEAHGEPAAALALQLQALAEAACDESAARDAMRLHAALGDRAAALALFGRLCQALRDELELAPTAQTQALAAQLRQGGEAPVPRPAQASATAARPAARLLADRLPFVGRGAARAQIEAAWAAGQRVYLSGVPGAGKTRLASECAAGRGAWLRVACSPNDAELPYASAIRALRALQEAAPDVALPDWTRRELAALLPELGPAPQPLASPEAAERLHAAFAHAWQLLVRDNFSALLLDDWQWGDPASVELWNRLDDAAAPVAWIVAYRSAQLPPAALQRLRRDVDAGGAMALVLDGLAADEALALVRVLSGSPGGTLFAQRLQRATEGNPFFLIETLRHLFEQGQLIVESDGSWSTPFDDITADYAELPIPASVRDAVLGRVRALGETARRLLEAASLLGEHFDLSLLDGATPVAAEDAVAALEHAHAARLVAEAGSGGGYRFAHDLVRQCLAESLSPARRRLLHVRLARRLEALGAAPALVARQWEGAGQPAAAVPWRQRAAEAAWRVHALADTQAQYAHALADGAAGSTAVAIHLALARLQRRLGDAAGESGALDAAVLAAEGSDGATRLKARLARAEAWCASDRAEDGLGLLDALAADLRGAPPAQRAQGLAIRATVLQWRGDAEASSALQREAIGLLEGVADALAQKADLLDRATRMALARGDLAGAAALARRAAAAFEATDDSAGLANALTLSGVAATFAGDRAGALAALERARTLASRCGHVPAERAAILNLIKLHTDAGRTAEALALLDAGEALAPGFEHQRAEQAFMQARYFVHYLRGDVPRADEQAGRLLALATRVADRLIALSSHQMVVDLYLHTGALVRARSLLDEADALVSQQMQGNGGVLRVPLAAKRAWLQLAEGDAAGALQRLPALGDAARDEDRLLIAWVGAAAALALGDTGTAGLALAEVDIAVDTVTDNLALVLEQRLLLARALGREDGAARTRALALLAAGQVPALEAKRLQAAIG